MSYETYKLLHIVGLILLFLGLGSALLGAEGEKRRAGSVLHGIGLLVMLVAGFGMLARLGFTSWPWPLWAILKLVVWLLLGALPVLVRKGVVPRAFGWLVAGGLGTAAAWLAIHHPWE